MSIQIKETEREIRYLKNILAVKHKHKTVYFLTKKDLKITRNSSNLRATFNSIN